MDSNAFDVDNPTQYRYYFESVRSPPPLLLPPPSPTNAPPPLPSSPFYRDHLRPPSFPDCHGTQQPTVQNELITNQTTIGWSSLIRMKSLDRNVKYVSDEKSTGL